MVFNFTAMTATNNQVGLSLSFVTFAAVLAAYTNFMVPLGRRRRAIRGGNTEDYDTFTHNIVKVSTAGNTQDYDAFKA